MPRMRRALLATGEAGARSSGERLEPELARCRSVYPFFAREAPRLMLESLRKHLERT